MNKKKILIAFGTRPEALKFAPLIKALKKSGDFKCYVCLTGQHREMVDQVIRLFKVKIDVDLRLMKENQSIEYVSGRVISRFGEIIRSITPDILFVQGDTATAVMVAIASYYSKTPIAHLEAGLRTYNKYHPFPEEGNRALISRLADYHFTPTHEASKNLLREGISKQVIFQVGNSIVDTVQMIRPLIKKNYSLFRTIDFTKRILFLTVHRRESFGKGLQQIFAAVKHIATKFHDVEILFPVHPNPQVTKPAHAILGNVPRMHLMRPFSYEETCWLMNRSHAILTDSGGIQEEAPSFGKPVLVLRNVTERPEGIKVGIAKIVGTDRAKIVDSTEELLISKTSYQKMVPKYNPYGDGKCTERILSHLKRIFNSDRIS